MLNISYKKILLIAPLFFGYYQKIIAEMEELGMRVDYVCDAPSNSNISKAVGRINKKFIKRSTQKYYKDMVFPKVSNKKYDYIMIIAGMTFAYDEEMIRQIRKKQANAVFIMYQWDSENNLFYSRKIHQFIDRLYSFDRNDCERDGRYTFLPLFYTEMYRKIPDIKNSNIRFDCSYIGTAHPQKYHDINMISKEIKEYAPKQFIYHYMPSKLKYIYHKLTAYEYRKAKYIEFQKEKIPFDNVKKIIGESRAILDAPQKGQTGLTIRTIECLGARRKLITTNKDVRLYDFYRPENILVFDQENNCAEQFDLFFKSDYVDLPNEIYEKYSLTNWILSMLCGLDTDNAV